MMRGATQKSVTGRLQIVVRGLAWVTGWIVAGTALCGEPPSPDAAAKATYDIAGAQFAGAPENPEVAWQLGRACFDWAEFATNHTQRAAIAAEGISACKAALEINPELAAAHYYLGMNLGQLARTKGLGALKLVRKMDAHFRKARELDPTLDQAGPDRNLGLLYLEAPGWPVSLGNRIKARKHLRRAVDVAPEFPENRLNLMEAYARWKDAARLKQELEAFDKQAAAAREKFSGSQWYWDWMRWEERLGELRQQAADSDNRLRSPKAKG